MIKRHFLLSALSEFFAVVGGSLSHSHSFPLLQFFIPNIPALNLAPMKSNEKCLYV